MLADLVHQFSRTSCWLAVLTHQVLCPRSAPSCSVGHFFDQQWECILMRFLVVQQRQTVQDVQQQNLS